MQAAEADKSRPFSRWALALVLLGAVGGPLWLWWTALRHSNINYLPNHFGANWIIYPSAPDLPPHQRLEVATVFKQTFALPQMPPPATLSVAGFHRYTVELNGKPLGTPTHKGRDWKEPDKYDVTALLRTGENQISVTVFNTNGPPALWCSLVAGAGKITRESDETWQASHAGATWRSARLATRTKWVPAGTPGFGAERPLESIKKRWPVLLLFAVVSVAAYFVSSRKQNPESRFRDHLPFFIAAAAFIALFVNNIGILPLRVGFDFEAHRDYIKYILDHHALPLASQGAEMYQPPLYYAACALWLKLLGLSTADQSGLVALRWLGFGIGLAHLAMLWATLRVLFPGQRVPQWTGMALAAVLPPLLYLGEYASNEAPSALLYTASLYLALRILRIEQPGWKLYVTLGLCLGAAMLAKASAVLLFPPILGALLWHAGRGKRAEGTGQRSEVRGRRSEVGGQRSQFKAILSQVLRIAAVGAICLAVCGWHYYGMWRSYGNPLIGSWDPKIGFTWWAANGYQTAMHYLRCGTALSYPWFSGLNSFADSIYSTLWGDSQFGGMTVLLARPPWNYELMATGYWLALVPTIAAILGAVLTLIRFIRRPAPEAFMLLSLFYLALYALVSISLEMPASALMKAFYGLPALVPFCAFAAMGCHQLWKWGGKFRAVPIVAFSVWALNSYASFWIVRASAAAEVSRPWSLYRDGHDAEAQRLLDARLARDPGNENARWVSTLIALKQKDHARATVHAQAILRDHPQSPAGHLAMALALADQGKAEEAKVHARAVIELAPGEFKAHELLTRLLLQTDHYEECEKVARDGLSVAPFDPELQLALGAALSGGANDAEAETHLQLAFTLNSKWPEGYMRLAWALAGRGRFEEGITALSQAARLAPNDAYTQFILANFLAHLNRIPEAQAAASHARELAVTAGQRGLVQQIEQLLQKLNAHP